MKLPGKLNRRKQKDRREYKGKKNSKKNSKKKWHVEGEMVAGENRLKNRLTQNRLIQWSLAESTNFIDVALSNDVALSARLEGC